MRIGIGALGATPIPARSVGCGTHLRRELVRLGGKPVLAAKAGCLSALAKRMPGNRAYEQLASANSTVLAGELQLPAGMGALHNATLGAQCLAQCPVATGTPA